MTVTFKERTRLRELCDAATDELWVGRSEGGACSLWVLCMSPDEEIWNLTKEDAQFIAAARTALPRLLDEVERLEKLFEASEADCRPLRQLEQFKFLADDRDQRLSLYEDETIPALKAQVAERDKDIAGLERFRALRLRHNDEMERKQKRIIRLEKALRSAGFATAAGWQPFDVQKAHSLITAALAADE